MKSQSVGGRSWPFGDVARRHAFGPRLHQQPENVEAVVLGERAKGGDGIRRFHISMKTEISGDVKKYFNDC